MQHIDKHEDHNDQLLMEMLILILYPQSILKLSTMELKFLLLVVG